MVHNFWVFREIAVFMANIKMGLLNSEGSLIRHPGTGEELIESLQDYGLAEAELQEVWQLHRQFHDTIASNRVVRKKANRIKAENRMLVNQAIKVLEYQIDEFIPSLESEAPELFGEYQRVRLIHDY
jgi:hypothetical protein